MRICDSAGIAGGPHPGRHHRPTLPQKRMGEGWLRRLASVRGAETGLRRTAAAGSKSRGNP
ncbi:hypothetical protein FHS01_001062 [Longimicrobium terrae]|uniref:Uncharacterized protein n=1 Tax=Longimicrobium terrae TaxID=1639882 RepID=A0A841GX63_9BACT|nr:hypothetical protein [Longimicrobium terrae]MBB6069446.1 hypothetical protein [Longimicrobium terrae]